MSYTPFIICPHCGNKTDAQVSGETGYQALCGCSESRDAWERAHREEIERRKAANRVSRRRGTKK